MAQQEIPAQKLQLSQEGRLSPALLQALQILRMNTQELAAYLQTALLENPLLEEDEAANRRFRHEAQVRLGSLDALPPVAGGDFAEDASLAAFLREQLERLRLPRELFALCVYLTGLLDEKGYLPPEEFADLSGPAGGQVPQALLTQGIAILQALEPAGVAAGSLSESLLLQLHRREGDEPPDIHALARMLAADYLPEVGKRRFASLAKKLGTDTEAVRRAADLLQTLNPRPGDGFVSGDSASPPPLFPDAYLVAEEGKIRVLLNQWALPQLQFSPTYRQMLRENPDKGLKAYLLAKLHGASGLLDAVEQRRQTLTRLLEVLAEVQTDFLLGRSPAPRPLTRKDLAKRTTLHPSTVTRALLGKTVQCPAGLFPLTRFFSRALGEASPAEVKNALQHLLAGENRAAPYSDRRLAELLGEAGFPLSRRAVAKYRADLNLPDSYARKEARFPL